MAKVSASPLEDDISSPSRAVASEDSLQNQSSRQSEESVRNESDSNVATYEQEPLLNDDGSSKLDGSSLRDVRYGSVALLKPWFPMVDPAHSRAKTWRTTLSRRQVVLWTSFSTCIFVFVVNFTLSLVGFLHYGLPYDGVATLYSGSCSTTKWLGTLIHLGINVLSSLLLGASTLCLQLLMAPTRNDINKAHAAQRWLDIGVPSFRNMCSLSLRNKILCFILAFSSIPIHFLYNSVVFSALSTNSFIWVEATEAFLHEPTWNRSQPLANGTEIVDEPKHIRQIKNFWIPPPGSQDITQSQLDADPSHLLWPQILRMHEDAISNFSSFTKISNYDCFHKYQGLFEWRPHVLLISENIDYAIHINSSVLRWDSTTPDLVKSGGVYDGSMYSFTWTRDESNIQDDSATAEDIEKWSTIGDRIQYCLVRTHTPGEDEQQLCHIQGSMSLLMVICVFNLLKGLTILFIIFRRHEHTICTLGDAIASFLEEPDKGSEGLGICTMEAVSRSDINWPKGGVIEWQPKELAWYRAASLRRWLFTMALCLFMLTAGIIVMTTGFVAVFKYSPRSWDVFSSLGFGEANNKELISWHQPTKGFLGILVNVVIANIWQVVISLCYMSINTLISCFLLAREWAQYGNERKTLRVSHPRGIQRSTYFISMPLRYGIPILGFFLLEHWLLSQTTFIIRVLIIDTISKVDTASLTPGWTTSGFSLLPAILAIVLPILGLLIIVIGAVSWKHHKISSMPFVSTCSIAISASCHPPIDDKEAYLLPVQWGVIEPDGQGRQRCSFTTLRDVQSPTPGHEYVGVPEKKRQDTNTQDWAKRLHSVFRRRKDQKPEKGRRKVS